MVYKKSCFNVEGVYVSLIAVERVVMSLAISSTYWLNKVNLCQRASRLLFQ